MRRAPTPRLTTLTATLRAAPGAKTAFRPIAALEADADEPDAAVIVADPVVVAECEPMAEVILELILDSNEDAAEPRLESTDVAAELRELTTLDPPVTGQARDRLDYN